MTDNHEFFGKMLTSTDFLSAVTKSKAVTMFPRKRKEAVVYSAAKM